MIKLTRCLMTLAACSMLAAAALAQEPGQWAERAKLLAPNSEFAVAELDGRLYILGGYPSDRVTVKTVQIYDIQADRWEAGPDLPQPINHGMAASVAGKVYLIGGQTEASGETYVDTVYEFDPKAGTWVEKAKMPTKRSAGVAIVVDGLIYVAGGRPPRGHDFAVYDPAADSWKVLDDLPTASNHIAGAAINGIIHVVGGRLGGGFRSEQTDAHQVYDPRIGVWKGAAPMLRARSGINGVLASGCLHVWGGEYAEGVFPDHDYYDPRSDRWTKLADMKIPVHGVTGSAFVSGLIFAPGGGTKQGGSSGSLHNQVYRPAVSCE